MATSTRRDVKLVVETETLGEDGLRRLAAEVRALAKAGGDAAPEFAAVAAELDRIAGQRAATDNLKALAADVAELATQQQHAAATAADLAVDLAAQAERVDQLRTAQAQAVVEVRQAAEALTFQSRALQDLKGQYDAAGRQTETYAALARAAQQAVRDADDALRDKRTTLADSNGELREAARAERTLSAEYDRVAAGAAASTSALRTRQQALADATASARAFGVEVENLADAEQVLQAATQEAVAALSRRQAASEEILSLDRQAADAAEALAARNRQVAEAYEADQKALAAAVRAQAEATEEARAEALRFVEALEAEAVAAERAARRTAELNAAAERTAQGAQYVAALEAAFRDLDAATAAAADEQRRFTAELEALDAQAAAVTKELAERNRQAAASFEADQRVLVDSIQAQAAATEAAKAEALQYVEALESQAVAAEQAARRTAELNAQAEKTARDAQYVREVAAAFDAVEEQARQAAAEVQRLEKFFAGLKAEANQVNQAFGQTGVRSFEAIQREMLGVNQAVARLRAEFAAGGISAQDLGRAVSSAQVRLAALKREMETVPAIPGTFERLSGTINGLINRFGALGAAIATVGVAVRPAIEATVALDQMRRVLTQVTGSAEEAGRQIEFVRSTSQRAGQSVVETGQAYSKFAASALQAGLSTQQVQEAFAGVALAAGNLGLGSEQAKRALEALSQMASKGVISMEELRQQLGDALPGVLPLLAKELGLTQQQLARVVESGQLLASEGIPAITRSLRALGPVSGEVSGLVAEWTRFKNVISETATILGDGALGKALGAGLSAVSEVVQRLAFGVALIGESFTVVGKQIGVTVAAIVTRDFKNLGDALAQIETESTQRLANLANRIGGTGAAAADAAPQVQALARAADASATGFEASAAAAGKAAVATQKTVAGTQAAAKATEALAVETGKVATETTKQAAGIAAGAKSYAQLALAMGDAENAARLAAQSAEKHTQATKDNAEATARLVEIAGDDVATKQAQAQAASAVAKAASAQARADAEVVTVLQTARTAQIAYAQANRFTAEQIADLTRKLDEKIAKAEADAEKSEKAAAAARAEAEARRISSEALRDNTSRAVEYRKELDASIVALAAVQRAFERDKATKDQVEEATLRVARAQRLFADAVADSLAAVERGLAVSKADSEIRVRTLELQRAQAAASQAEAEMLGRETAARVSSIRQKELSLQISKEEVATEKARADAIIESTRQASADLQARNLLTPEMAAQNELRIKEAQAARLAAEAKEAGLRVVEKEIETLKRNSAAIDANTSARERNRSSQLNAIGLDSQGRNADGLVPGAAGSLSSSFDEYNKRNTRKVVGATYDAQGFATDASGNRITAGSYLPPPDDSGDWVWVPKLNQGYPFGGYWQRTETGGSNQLSGTSIYDGRQPARGIATPGTNTVPVPRAAPAAPTAAPVYTVNVNLNGRTTKINTASSSDQAALANLLRDLETAAERGG